MITASYLCPAVFLTLIQPLIRQHFQGSTVGHSFECATPILVLKLMFPPGNERFLLESIATLPAFHRINHRKFVTAEAVDFTFIYRICDLRIFTTFINTSSPSK